MFNYFLRNRHGSISVMLAVLLIGVLSLNTSLLEIARYRSVERIYRELTENAAFSVLGYYDRDLYKDYGLLAIEQSAGKEEFQKYMKKNLSGLADMTQDIDLAKIYDLTQEDVLRAQIMEFTAYRAPLSLVNNALNIEEVMGQLMKELKNALPIFEMFLDMLKAYEKMIGAVDKLDKYAGASRVLREAIGKYRETVGYYNGTIGEREKFINDYYSRQEGSEDENSTDTLSQEEFEQRLEEHNSLVEEHAVLLQEDIIKLAKALADQQKAYGEFLDAIESMQAANMGAIINDAERELDQIKDSKTKEGSKMILKSMESGLKESETIFRTVINSMDNEREGKTVRMLDELERQRSEIASVQRVEDYRITEEIGVKTAGWLETAIRVAIAQVNLAVSVVQSWCDALKVISDFFKAIEIVQTEGGTYDWEYNSNISGDIWGGLPGKQNGDKLKPINNPYAQRDIQTVNSQLAKTEEAAAGAEFDLGIFTQTEHESEINMLRNAISRVQRAEYEFRTKCTSWGGIKFLFSIVEAIMVLVEYVSSIIGLIKVFIQIGGNIQLLLQCMYQGVYAASYANDMFSNRTTTEKDKRLNGSSFGTTSGTVTNEAFVRANAEYILGGSNDEIENQKSVFYMLLSIRMLCNLPAVLTNEKAMDLIKSCPEPITLVIVAIVVVCGLCLLEGWMDMIVMLYGGGEVDIIKKDGYFTFEKKDTKKLMEELKKISASLKAKKSKEKLSQGTGETEKTLGKYVKDYGEKLLKWTYKDHLFLLMLLSLPSEIIYARCADLIEMQMKQKKKLDGSLDGFELENMATYIRVESEARYKPLLPIPAIPGINGRGIKISSMYYSGY